nr:lipopolysaccharide biosynthesis protein [Methylobacterium sp. Leaf399]
MTVPAATRSIPADAFVGIRRSGPASVPAGRSVGTASRAAATVFGIRIAAAGFAYGAQVLMARLLGAAEFGIVAAVSVWIAILGHAASLGFSQGACRFLPIHRANGDLDAVRGFLRAGTCLSLTGGIALAGFGLGLVWIEGSLPGGPFAGPILVAALILPLFALQDYCEGLARSQNRAVLAIAPPYLLRQGVMMAALLAAIGLGLPPEAATALACLLVATAVALSVQALALRRLLGRSIPNGPRRYAWRTWLGACVPIAAGDLAGAGLGVADVVVLSLVASPQTVGLYFAATRIQQFVAFVAYAATAATAHRFAALAATGERGALQDLVRHQARLTALGTALVGSGLLAVAPWLLDLFGPGFRDGLPILAILVGGSLGASLFGPGEHILAMLGGERLAAGITLSALVLAALLTGLLFAWIGVTGAATAMALAVNARALAMAIAANALHGIATPVLALPGSSRR